MVGRLELRCATCLRASSAKQRGTVATRSLAWRSAIVPPAAAAAAAAAPSWAAWAASAACWTLPESLRA